MSRCLIAILLCTGAWAQLTPAWVELGEGRTKIVRIVVESGDACPIAQVDGAALPLLARVPVPDGMKPVCELTLPDGVKAATVNGQSLALGKLDPGRIVVIGDTGCRVKGDRIQDCNDPAKWPLQRVAMRAASEKPDLVVHVGDYLYREDKCPEDLKHLCGVGSSGDRWDTWAADFFTPAAKLLAAAPWAFSRGNHEDCSRAWRGWFYYLDPRPWTKAWNDADCEAYSAPYLVSLGNLELFMLDSSAAKDKAGGKQVDLYAKQLQSLHPTNAWLVDHHPFWGMKMTGDGKGAEQLATPLTQAWEDTKPSGISLIVSGHTHLFELLGSDRNRPPQLIAGDGGTKLADAIPESFIVAGTSRQEFGYTLVTALAGGWNVALKAPVSGTIVTCTIQGSRTECGKVNPPARSSPGVKGRGK